MTGLKSRRFIDLFQLIQRPCDRPY